jgi:hypothetical protein
MERGLRNRGLAVAALALATAWSWAQTPGPKRATGMVELDDAAGDIEGIHSTGGEEPPLDVTHVKISSDGKRLSLDVTLAQPPGDFASSALDVYVDTDHDPKTGPEVRDHGSGWDYKLKLESCIDYTDGASACEGGSSKAKPKSRWAAVNLDKLTDSSFSGDTVVDSMGFFGAKASAKTPVTGKVLAGGIDYADLGVKPGQTIRLLMRETGGSPTDDGYFPEVLLTLK